MDTPDFCVLGRETSSSLPVSANSSLLGNKRVADESNFTILGEWNYTSVVCFYNCGGICFEI